MSNIIGQTLLDQYRVDTFVASGGMGAVYRVWDLKRNVSLAMKVLHNELAEDPSMFKRFQREANALKKLAHPNIVPFYGLYQTLDFTFLLERFIDGPSLKDVLKQRQGRSLPIGEALVYFKALCAALGYAHASGVVHCDVKSGNVMIDRGGSIYLTDFGIARHAESTTTTMGTAGTPSYMAPEQIRGQAVSPATDVYALGVVLYEMLTGQRPFRGTEPGSEKGGGSTNERIRYGHLLLQPPDPRSLNPALSGRMAAAILKALAKSPSARYQTMQEFMLAVSAAAGVSERDIPERAMFVIEMEREMPRASPVPASIPARETPPRKVSSSARTGMVVVIILFVVVAVVIGSIAIWGGPIPTPSLTALDITHPLLNTTLPPPTSTPTWTLTPTFSPTFTLTFTPTPTLTFTPTNTVTPSPALSIGSTWARPADGMMMVYVPAGDFTMGSPNGMGHDDEHPQHIVYLDAFWIDQTEVTNAMYAKCVSVGACQPPSSSASYTRSSYYGNSAYVDYPVIFVTWNAASVYCTWAGARLPSEAEWEKAARGTDGSIYPWGDNSPNSSLLNYNMNVGDTTAVGSYPSGASPYGALDMAGNVWEWVNDWYDDTYYSQSLGANPNGLYTGQYRVLRGGAWNNDDDGVRSANRYRRTPDDKHSGLGFRCSRSP